MTTRTDRLRVIRDFDQRTVDRATGDLLTSKQLTLLDLLPDDMVAELAKRMQADWQFAQKLNERNRSAK